MLHTLLTVSTAEIEIARSQWQDAHRRLQQTRRDRTRFERLMRQVEAVTEELRKRIGETFTTAQLVREYGGAERWTRSVLAELGPEARHVGDLALVEDAAFHLYARRAVDYQP